MWKHCDKKLVGYNGDNVFEKVANKLFGGKAQYTFSITNEGNRSATLLIRGNEWVETVQTVEKERGFTVEAGLAAPGAEGKANTKSTTEGEKVWTQETIPPTKNREPVKILVDKHRHTRMTLLIEEQVGSGEYYVRNRDTQIDANLFNFVIEESDVEPTGSLHTFSIKEGGRLILEPVPKSWLGRRAMEFCRKTGSKVSKKTRKV